MNCCEKNTSLPHCCEGCRCVTHRENHCLHYVCGCDGCGWFDMRCRDRFWPHFAHPRRMPLTQLYSCGSVQKDTCCEA